MEMEALNIADNLTNNLISLPVLIGFIFGLLLGIATLWIIYEKAGEEGWKVFIPFYSNYILSKIVFGNGWLFLLALVPFIGTFFPLVQYWKLGTVFGKETGFKIGLIFLPVVFLAILAFGDSEYEGCY